MPSISVLTNIEPIWIAVGLFALSILVLVLWTWFALLKRDPLGSRVEKMSSSCKAADNDQAGKLRIRKKRQACKKNHNSITILLVRAILLFSLVALAIKGLSYVKLEAAIRWFIIGGAGFMGWLIPGMLVDRWAKRRNEDLSREVPRFLDLMVVAVEAGLGLDAAFLRVQMELKESCPLLQSHITTYLREVNSGLSRTNALRSMGERSGNQEVVNLTTVLLQATQFGVSIAKTLRIHADAVRTRLVQETEERAAKIPLKLIFPVVFGILPAVLAVVLGPGIIRISQLPIFD